MVDFTMFTELHFLFMSFSTILLFTWFIVPYFYLAKLMTTYDYTESEASVVISMIGITNAIGMVIHCFLFICLKYVYTISKTMLIIVGCIRLGWRSTMD